MDVKYDYEGVLLPPYSGKYGVTPDEYGGRVIVIGYDAVVRGDAFVANTIAHEVSHARDVLKGLDKPHGVETSPPGDGTVYGAGNALQAWIEGQR